MGTAPAARDRCARTREALRTCALVDEATGPPAAPVDATDVTSLEVLAAVHEMENALDRLPLAMAFLVQGPSAPPREPIAPQPLFTADCTLANGEAVRLAIKAGVVLDAVDVLVDDVRALDEARRITSQAVPGTRPSPRPQTPAPQPS